MIFNCALCNKIYLIEDSHECDKCHKTICPECAVNMSTGPDDPAVWCKDCVKHLKEGVDE